MSCMEPRADHRQIGEIEIIGKSALQVTVHSDVQSFTEYGRSFIFKS